MRGMKRKTKTREHKDLQLGQFGVLVEEAIWNCADLVLVQAPKRKKVQMRKKEKEKQRHGNTKTYKTAKAVLLARKPSGIVLISLLNIFLKEKSSNETDEKEKKRKREHRDLQVGQQSVIF